MVALRFKVSLSDSRVVPLEMFDLVVDSLKDVRIEQGYMGNPHYGFIPIPPRPDFQRLLSPLAVGGRRHNDLSNLIEMHYY